MIIAYKNFKLYILNDISLWITKFLCLLEFAEYLRVTDSDSENNFIEIRSDKSDMEENRTDEYIKPSYKPMDWLTGAVRYCDLFNN